MSEIQEINGRKYEVDMVIPLTASQHGWLSSVETDIKRDMHEAKQRLATAENATFQAAQALDKHQEFANHRISKVRDELLKEHGVNMLPGQELIKSLGKNGEPVLLLAKEALLMTHTNGVKGHGRHAHDKCQPAADPS